MVTTKVTLGPRLAVTGVAPGSIEKHYGHDFIVQPDLTLVCDMAKAFADAEIASGRVVPAIAEPRPEPAIDLGATIKPSTIAKRGRMAFQIDNDTRDSPPTE